MLSFSALSQEQAAISALHTVIGQLLGWGAFAVPISMFAVGVWLIIRHFGDTAPTIDPVRLTGGVLAFLSLLIFFQYLDSFSYAAIMPTLAQCNSPSQPACVEALVQRSYQSGQGGGFIGGWFYSALVNNLTEIGGLVVVGMTLTVSAMLITRSSMAELAVVAISLSRELRSRGGQFLAARRAARLQAQRELAFAQPEAQVQVSKPPPAQLTGAGLQALPEPSTDWMPIPKRLRALFSQAGKAAPESEVAPLEAAGGESTAAPGASLARRFFARSKEQAEPVPAAEAPPRRKTNYLERFLNLGDDLPPPAAEPPVSQAPPKANLPGSSAPRAYSPAPPRRTNKPAPIAPAAAEAPDLKSANDDDAPPKPKITPLPPAPSTAAPSAARPPAARETLPPAPEEESPKEASAAAVAEPEPAAASPPAAAPGEPEPVKPPPSIDWQLPDQQALLNKVSASDLDQEPLLRQAQIIEETLASFGAPGRVVEINSGPVITQYGVEPAYLTARTGKRNRVKVGAIAKLDKDLQLALGARSIRMEAPVPGKGYVGIEVPNPIAARVSLRDVMESPSYQQIESPLAIALGMSVDGRPIAADLTQMPHLLIAGATGAGKSVCINAIINSILVNNSPAEVKFIMVDPKRVELTGYNGLPHLIAPVVVELERIVGVLRWVTTEMDERYKMFSQAGARNIIDYNSFREPDSPPMHYIVVIIDELADLMMMAPDDTERAITRIAALARATGIHLIIATQRPSVDVVTGLIKANCPARIAFAVAGSVDSRVILDQPGAERLLGKGDMLYLSGNAPAPLRMQGVWVSNEEIERISRFWKLQGAGLPQVSAIPLPPPSSPTAASSQAPPAAYRQKNGQTAFWDMSGSSKKAGGGADEEEKLYQTAVELVRKLDKASISLLQRRLRIGYQRAARIVDMMEEHGVVGPPKEGSSKPRDVLPRKEN